MRHSFVSMCRERNVPLSVVESLVGHSNPAMTRHYTHTSEEAASQAIRSLPNIMDDQAGANKCSDQSASSLNAAGLSGVDVAKSLREMSSRLKGTTIKAIQSELQMLAAELDEHK